MDFLFDLIFEIYIELMMLAVPEEKSTSKKYRIIAIIIASLSLCGILALAVWGLVLIIDKTNALGWIPLSFAILLSLAQIIAGIILRNRKYS